MTSLKPTLPNPDIHTKKIPFFLLLMSASFSLMLVPGVVLIEPGWLSFFTQHRKYGYLVILVAQNDRMLDRQVRALIEYEEIHRKVSNFGVFGAILKTICRKEVFFSVRRWYPLKERVGLYMFVPKKKIFSFV